VNRRSAILHTLGLLLAALAARRTCSAAPPIPIDPPVLWGDGVHDDLPAIQGLVDGRPVVRPDGTPVYALPRGEFLVTQTITVR